MTDRSLQAQREDALAVLTDLERGKFLPRFAAELAAVVLAARDTGNKGTLTVRIDVKPSPADPEMIEVESEVTAKMPKGPKVRSIFFAADEGRLVRTDPPQAALDLLPRGERAAKEV